MKESKNIITISLIAIIVIGLFYMNAGKDTQSITINGNVINPKGDTIRIYYQDTSFITTLSENGNFYTEFSISEQDYLNFFHGDEVTAMYLNPGDKVDLIIDTKEFDETIKYNGSKESSFLAWKFLELEKMPKLNLINLSEEELNQALENKFKTVILELNKFKSINNYFYNKEKKRIDGNKKYFINKHKKLTALPKKGEDAIDFMYPNMQGDLVSLSDFKGEIVYIDVWATWCGPCKIEIPYLKDLETEYRDKNIVFMGVSVDVEAKRQAWLDMIEEKDIKGIQLFANGWSKITKDYAINSIPRFMIFDANGKVVNLDAPRPSSSDIRDILNNLINK